MLNRKIITAYSYTVISFVLMFVFSCVVGGGKSIDTYNASERKLYDRYKSNNISVAEQSLWDLEKIVNDYKNTGVKGLDYNAILGFLYARLYLIYQQKGELSKSKEFLKKASKYLSAGKNMTEEEIYESQKKLIKMIKRIDKRESVMWQK